MFILSVLPWMKWDSTVVFNEITVMCEVWPVGRQKTDTLEQIPVGGLVFKIRFHLHKDSEIYQRKSQEREIAMHPSEI